jgi:hypothetical protein
MIMFTATVPILAVGEAAQTIQVIPVLKMAYIVTVSRPVMKVRMTAISTTRIPVMTAIPVLMIAAVSPVPHHTIPAPMNVIPLHLMIRAVKMRRVLIYQSVLMEL